MSDIEIRRLTPDDDATLNGLVLDFHDLSIPLDRCREILENENNYIMAAFKDDEAVGWTVSYRLQRYTKDEMFLYEVDVSPDYRRQGIATALVENIKTFTAENGFQGLFVMTNAENDEAMGLYGKTGATRKSGDDVLFEW